MGRRGHIAQAMILAAVPLWLSGCFQTAASTATVTTTTPTAGATCASLTGTSWDPSAELTAAGLGDSNHDATTTVATQDLTSGNGVMTGADDSFLRTSAHLMSVSFTVSSDLGPGGSISLAAEVDSLPGGLSGLQGWPVLVSLTAPNPEGGTLEWVNFDTTAGTGSCPSARLYSCTGGSCGINSACNMASPSAFFANRTQWEQHQNFLETGKSISVATFPTCNWTSGSPSCAFTPTGTNHFLTGTGRLPQGTYTAKYAVMANYLGSTIGDSYATRVKVRVIRKTDAQLLSGAVDLNIVLVGNKNINASRTDKGKQNLNELMKQVHRIYSGKSGDSSNPTGASNSNFAGSNAASTNIRIGKVTAYEWDCSNGGDAYADLTLEQLSTLNSTGSLLLDQTSEGKALNIFIVSTLPSSILGISGGITGAMKNGTGASGLVFASFNKLSSFNPSCAGTGTCAYSQQESAFIDMGGTIAHEIGHFLGLNHPSEYMGTTHDAVPDTPECTLTVSCSLGSCITQNSCYSTSNGATCPAECGAGYTSSNNVFCPLALSCQFNHVMWWTTKKIKPAIGSDGQGFSAQSGAMMNFSPLVQ
jgi:hypothetical protein